MTIIGIICAFAGAYCMFKACDRFEAERDNFAVYGINID